MKVEILTIFPEIFSGFLSSSLVKKSIDRGELFVKLNNFRDYSTSPHKQVDDSPYGGGPGMVLKPEPLVAAVEDAKTRLPNSRVILLSPSGTILNQEKAQELSLQKEWILICGRYEGVDQRVIDLVVDEEISVGDYILMGGEVPAMICMEAALRLVPGILGNDLSTLTESFSAGLLEAPQYTRPAEFRGLAVPDVLLSGDHKQINSWRSEQSLRLTASRRPDLIKTSI